MRAIIVDDEAPARDRLRIMLGDHPDVEIVEECGRATEALRAIRAARPDVVFLDVEMPGLDGFHVVDTMNVSPPPFVIFVTAHSEHAVQAFDRAAGDYLLKPYDDERLARAVNRARTALRSRTTYPERFAVPVGKRTVLVATDDVDWLEARDNYVCLHVGAERYLLRQTLNGIEAKLDPARFARIHRSAIVRLDRIKEIRHLGLGEQSVVLASGTVLPVGPKYRDRLPS